MAAVQLVRLRELECSLFLGTSPGLCGSMARRLLPPLPAKSSGTGNCTALGQKRHCVGNHCAVRTPSSGSGGSSGRRLTTGRLSSFIPSHGRAGKSCGPHSPHRSGVVARQGPLASLVAPTESNVYIESGTLADVAALLSSAGYAVEPHRNGLLVQNAEPAETGRAVYGAGYGLTHLSLVTRSLEETYFDTVSPRDVFSKGTPDDLSNQSNPDTARTVLPRCSHGRTWAEYELAASGRGLRWHCAAALSRAWGRGS